MKSNKTKSISPEIAIFQTLLKLEISMLMHLHVATIATLPSFDQKMILKCL